MKWEEGEEILLFNQLNSGLSIGKIAINHGRTYNSIVHRIKKLLYDDYNFGKTIEELTKNYNLEYHIVDKYISEYILSQQQKNNININVKKDIQDYILNGNAFQDIYINNKNYSENKINKTILNLIDENIIDLDLEYFNIDEDMEYKIQNYIIKSKFKINFNLPNKLVKVFNNLNLLQAKIYKMVLEIEGLVLKQSIENEFINDCNKIIEDFVKNKIEINKLSYIRITELWEEFKLFYNNNPPLPLSILKNDFNKRFNYDNKKYFGIKIIY